MTKTFTRILSLILCIVLIAATALLATGCSDNNNTVDDGVVSDVTGTDTVVVGEGETTFGFTVVDKDGNTTVYEVHTDKTTVGEALLELELIAGDESEYGLYVKTVNGITADYNVDGTYWAFYIGDEYAMTGVDSTDIVAGESYTFKVEE